MPINLITLLVFLTTGSGKSLTSLSNTRVAHRLISVRTPPAPSTKEPLVGDALNDGALSHATAPQTVDAAMPFIRIEATNQTLVVERAAVRALASLPGGVCVIGMAGTARDGKSSFLNMLSHLLRSRWSSENVQGSYFPVGHDLDACTEGAWIRLFRGRGGKPLGHQPQPKSPLAAATAAASAATARYRCRHHQV